MKKKILLILFIIIILLICVAIWRIIISNNSSNKNNGKENIERTTYSLGDTVKTDKISLKITAGKFTYALVNMHGEDFGTPKEYNAENDNANPYVAPKGHTLVAFTFYIENLDRTSVNIESLGYITYNGKNYIGTNFIATSNNGLKWESYSSRNILLMAGKKKYFRAYMDIDTDVETLDDTIELTIKLPTSKDKPEEFTYIISKNDGNNYKNEDFKEEQ